VTAPISPLSYTLLRYSPFGTLHVICISARKWEIFCGGIEACLRADTLKTPYDIQKMMEIDCEEERLLSCLDVFQTARDHLRLRQRLKNIIDKRIPLDGEAGDVDESGGDKE